MGDILDRLAEAIEETQPVEGLQTEVFLHETYMIAAVEIAALRTAVEGAQGAGFEDGLATLRTQLDDVRAETIDECKRALLAMYSQKVLAGEEFAAQAYEHEVVDTLAALKPEPAERGEENTNE